MQAFRGATSTGVSEQPAYDPTFMHMFETHVASLPSLLDGLQDLPTAWKQHCLGAGWMCGIALQGIAVSAALAV